MSAGSLSVSFFVVTSTGPVSLWGWGLCPGAPAGSTSSGSGSKAFHQTGPRLNVSSDRLGKPGIERGTPVYKASDLFTTPWRFSH